MAKLGVTKRELNVKAYKLQKKELNDANLTYWRTLRRYQHNEYILAHEDLESWRVSHASDERFRLVAVLDN